MSNSTVQTIVFLVSIAVMFLLGTFLAVRFFNLDPIPPGLGILWGLVTVIVSTGAAILVYREKK